MPACCSRELGEGSGQGLCVVQLLLISLWDMSRLLYQLCLCTKGPWIHFVALPLHMAARDHAQSAAVLQWTGASIGARKAIHSSSSPSFMLFPHTTKITTLINILMNVIQVYPKLTHCQIEPFGRLDTVHGPCFTHSWFRAQLRIGSSFNAL